MPPPNASPLEDFSPRMLAARVLSGFHQEEPPAPVATAKQAYRRRPGASWQNTAKGLEAGLGGGAKARVHSQPYPKVRA